MVSGLFHSPRRGAFHRSLTVLVRYRSSQVLSLGGWAPQLPTSFHEARGTQATGDGSFATLRASHPLCGAIPGNFASRRTIIMCRAYNPGSLRFGLCRVRSPLLAASRLISVPRGTEMFQFPRCPSAALCIQAGIADHAVGWVAPFGDSRISACARLPGNVSARAPSFIGL